MRDTTPLAGFSADAFDPAPAMNQPTRRIDRLVNSFYLHLTLRPGHAKPEAAIHPNISVDFDYAPIVRSEPEGHRIGGYAGCENPLRRRAEAPYDLEFRTFHSWPSSTMVRSRSKPAFQKARLRSSQSRASVIGSGFNRQHTYRPRRSRSIRPACSSTSICLIMAGRDAANGSASAPTETSRSRVSRSTIARRVGSASEENTSSSTN